MIDQPADSRPPCPELWPYISAYVFLEGSPSQPFRDVRPPDWGGIGLALSGHWSVVAERSSIDSGTTVAWLVGPSSCAYSLSGAPGSRAVHVAFGPLGWAGLMDGPAYRYTDHVLPLADIDADAANSLANLASLSKPALAHRLDRFLLARVLCRPSPLQLQASTLVLNPKLTTVQEFADRLGRSTRQAARLTRDLFGLPPKLLLRRQRFWRTLDLMRSSGERHWAKALDESYYDHSHFIRDFRRFMGVTPTQYRASTSSPCPIFPIRPVGRRT